MNTPWFCMFSRDHFRKTLGAFHIVDNSIIPTRDDPLYRLSVRLGPLLDYVNNICMHYFMASLGFIAPPPRNFRSPLDTKAPRPLLIYLVGLLAISDSHINICIGPPNTCVALKHFNLLPPNTLFWSNFIYYPLTCRFEAITLGRIKNFGITLTETDKLRVLES